jgi:uncharacterized protein (DUF1800 family)
MIHSPGLQVVRFWAPLIALCVAVNGASAQAVTSFTVVNADTGADIATVLNSATVSIATTPRINIRANTSGTVSVVFTDSGGGGRTDNVAPFSYKGNSGPVYNPWSPAAGTYVINARPHAGSGGSGTAGTTATITLTVVGTTPPPPPGAISRSEAARFLAQATFGPTDADISRLQALGYSAWIDEQLTTARSETHRACFEAVARVIKANDQEVISCVWKSAFTGQDQLRLRMAYALSQIFVVSLDNGDVDDDDRAVAAWADGLAEHGLGNFRSLLQHVSLHPVMGLMLSHLGNQKADAATGRVPDENYAREVMQLFSIGLDVLNADGTPATDANGARKPTYTPADVSALARVFTGWSWACPDAPKPNCFRYGENNDRRYADRGFMPMINYSTYHSPEAKSFLNVNIPANTSADESLRLALDGLYRHANVGPFIGRQLIQRFTTSNPSPAYVRAVAEVFNNNGSGVRGDMKAVLKAVLMHPEARIVSNTSGKVREPVLRLSAFVRAFPHSSRSGRYSIEITDNPGTALGQAPLHALSVFNFYRPGYVAPGSQSALNNMTAPELQILNETSAAGYVNFMRDSISRGVGFPAGEELPRRDLIADYSAELALAADVPALVERVTSRLTYGFMSAARRTEISNAVSGIALPGAGSSASQIDAAKRSRVHAAILLTVSTPEFVVLK